MKCRYIITLILFPISFLNAMFVTIPNKDILTKRFGENNLINREQLIEKLAEQRVALLHVVNEVDNADMDANARERLVEALLGDNQDAVVEAHILLALERVSER